MPSAKVPELRHLREVGADTGVDMANKLNQDPNTVPVEQWEWYGHAGHLIVSSKCLFHLFTRVGYFMVSTVGDYYPNLGKHGDNYGEQDEVGYERKYETYVFYLGSPVKRCTCGCNEPKPSSFSEIDALPADDAETARQNHMTLCHKYAVGAMQRECIVKRLVGAATKD